MDENGNDLEAGALVNIPRNLNKKIRKRKHLDALLKFRSRKNNSNDILRSSEDELFLPHQKSSIIKHRSSPYHRYWYYSKRILSFTFLCIFLILCLALIYANIQLKSEVQNLSSRINEIEKKFSNVELKNISSMIEQMKTRLDSLERRKLLFRDNSEIPDQLEHIVNGRINEWNQQFKSFRNELENFNQSIKFSEWKKHLEQITNLVHNSSDKTSVMLTEFQSNLDKLRKKIDDCKCSSVIDNEQSQENLLTKPNVINPSTTSASKNLINDAKQTKDTIDIEQIVNG